MVETKGMPIRYPEFGGRVLAAMKERNADVQGIVNFFKARGIKITYEMVRRYSLGQAMPRPDRIALLAEALGRTPAELQFGEQPKPEHTPDMAAQGAPSAAALIGPQTACASWIFRFDKSRYDRLSAPRKRTIELLVLGQISEWEDEDKMENRHAS